MALNPFFNQFTNTSEQSLYEDLVVEAIRIYAYEMLYLPRTRKETDDIMNEVTMAEFNQAISCEFFIKNFMDFEGEGQILAKFGLEVRDQMTVNLSKRSFEEFIKPNTNSSKPNEGDCIYIPMLDVVYQIKYVSTTPVFYSFGSLNMYEITMELIDFTGEKFNTGDPRIDNKYKEFENLLTDPDYNLEDYDLTAQNSVIQSESDDIVDFSENSPFGEE